MNPKQIFEEHLVSQLIQRGPALRNINAIYQFKITGPTGGNWFLDLTSDPPYVRVGVCPAPHCIVTLRDSDFVDVVSGKLDGIRAFMVGKLQVQGDLGLAMRLPELFHIK
ncbi:MAG TPA: SCP2 sterol-binding domain-containing protein [Bdellovibrionota bacterium]|nr:SCP2 sterol-binding domain-containing protein [Bdellovibrionota bacterium]